MFCTIPIKFQLKHIGFNSTRKKMEREQRKRDYCVYAAAADGIETRIEHFFEKNNEKPVVQLKYLMRERDRMKQIER